MWLLRDQPPDIIYPCQLVHEVAEHLDNVLWRKRASFGIVALGVATTGPASCGGCERIILGPDQEDHKGCDPANV